MLFVHVLFKIRMYCTTVGCLGVKKLENKGMHRSFSSYIKPLVLRFIVICFVILEQNLLNCSYGRMTESPYVLKPLPSGMPIPICFCDDPCKVDISEDEATYKQRYWMCSNFALEPTEHQRRSTFIVRNCFCLLINLYHMKFCILIGFETIAFAADPSTAM
jgi:hypothetical protein